MDDSKSSEDYLIGLVVGCRAAVSHIPLSAIDFMNETNRQIWHVAEQLESSGGLANFLTITDSLNEKNIPCPLISWNNFLNVIVNDYKFMKNDKRSIENAVSKIKQSKINIEVQKIGEELSRSPENASHLTQLLIEATSNSTNRTSTTLNNGVKKAMDLIELKSKQGNPTGALTGISALDDELGGFQESDFVVVGARSAMGKTSFCQTCMEYAVKDGRYTGIISVEMPDVQLGFRHLASASGVNLKSIRSGNTQESDWAKIGHALSTVTAEERKRFLINDWTNDWDVIKTQIRTWANNYDMSGGVWIDYLQNLRVNRDGRSLEKIQEAMIVSYECKALAKELNIPIIGLSQLQRGIDQQKDKRPSKSNLSWASQFENDADLIMLIYRHEVYHPENQHAKGVAEVIIDKYRNGECTNMIIGFEGYRMKFTDLSESLRIRYSSSLNEETENKKVLRADFG